MNYLQLQNIDSNFRHKNYFTSYLMISSRNKTSAKNVHHSLQTTGDVHNVYVPVTPQHPPLVSRACEWVLLNFVRCCYASHLRVKFCLAKLIVQLQVTELLLLATEDKNIRKWSVFIFLYTEKGSQT